MSGEIVRPFGPSVLAPEPDKDVVELLERWLDRARRGEIVAVAVAGVAPNRDITTEWHGGAGANSMLAAMAYLQFRYTKAYDETQ